MSRLIQGGGNEKTIPEMFSGECNNSSRDLIQINADEKLVIDSAEKKLEELAGVIAELG